MNTHQNIRNTNRAKQMNLTQYSKNTYVRQKAPNFMLGVIAMPGVITPPGSKCFPKSTHHFQTLFMQNKANFKKVETVLSLYKTRDYENMQGLEMMKNKPNSNPIKANVNLGKKTYNSLSTNTIRQKYANLAKTKQTQNKPNFDELCFFIELALFLAL